MEAIEFKKAFELCAYCPKMCRFACPVAETTSRETYTPWAKMSAGHYLLGDALAIGEVAQAAYGCTGCGACTDYCEHGNDVASALFTLRADAFDAGVHDPRLDSLIDSFDDAAYRTDPELARTLDTAVGSELLDEKHETVYLPGTSALRRGPEPLREATRVLQHLGGTIGVFPHAIDCGLELYQAGAWEKFEEVAQAFARAVDDHSTLILGSASWTWALQELYPDFGIDISPKVMHATEWLARLLEERVLTPRRKLKGPLAYHDPCYLARHLESTEAARAILDELVDGEILELSPGGVDPVCCGASGLMDTTMPVAARDMAQRLLDAAGSAKIVSGSSGCAAHMAHNGAEVLDFMSLVGRCL